METDDDAQPQDGPDGDAVWAMVRRHPFITGTLVGCTVVGAGLGLVYLSGEWSELRRIAAGAVAGVGVGLLLTTTKMLG